MSSQYPITSHSPVITNQSIPSTHYPLKSLAQYLVLKIQTNTACRRSGITLSSLHTCRTHRVFHAASRELYLASYDYYHHIGSDTEIPCEAFFFSFAILRDGIAFQRGIVWRKDLSMTLFTRARGQWSLVVGRLCLIVSGCHEFFFIYSLFLRVIRFWSSVFTISWSLWISCVLRTGKTLGY